MTRYAVHFEDDPALEEVRAAHAGAHLAYLARCAGRVTVAGSLHGEGGRAAVGGFWLVDAASELEVRELVEGDPYFLHGLRRTVRVWRFTPTLAPGLPVC